MKLYQYKTIDGKQQVILAKSAENALEKIGDKLDGNIEYVKDIPIYTYRIKSVDYGWTETVRNFTKRKIGDLVISRDCICVVFEIEGEE